MPIWLQLLILHLFKTDRLFVTMSSPGEEVDRQLCRDAIFPIPVACYAPCPKDCVLSMWSLWSSCSHTCSGKTTEGKQIRARSILAYAGEEGKAGPQLQKWIQIPFWSWHPFFFFFLSFAVKVMLHKNLLPESQQFKEI